MKDEKIFEDFEDEMMSDEELDNVAGRCWRQTCEDSYFLNRFGLCGRYSGTGVEGSNNYFNDSAQADYEVHKAWKKTGIECVVSIGENNKYFIGKQEISREEAYRIVEQKYHGVGPVITKP